MRIAVMFTEIIAGKSPTQKEPSNTISLVCELLQSPGGTIKSIQAIWCLAGLL